MKEDWFICYSSILRGKQSQPMCLHWFRCVCGTWCERGQPSSAKVFSHGYKVLHWSQAQHSFTSQDSEAKADSQARWWQLGQGLIFNSKTNSFEHMSMANNPNNFLVNESTYQWQHQRNGVKGGYVKHGIEPLHASMGWENQILERDDCLSTYINNQEKDVSIFSNRFWAKDFYPLFLFY